MKDAHLVKDIIQQLFLYLWEKRETIQDARDVKSYLITSFLRKLTADWKKNKESGLLKVVWSSYPEDPQPNPEEKLIRKDEQSHLFKLLMDRINELPNRQKELITLKFYEGLTYEEIVQRTGLSHRTVYNKIHEGLKKLKLDIVKSQHPRSAALNQFYLPGKRAAGDAHRNPSRCSQNLAVPDQIRFGYTPLATRERDGHKG